MKAGGGIVCFELSGGLESGRRFMDALELLSRRPYQVTKKRAGSVYKQHRIHH